MKCPRCDANISALRFKKSCPSCAWTLPPAAEAALKNMPRISTLVMTLSFFLTAASLMYIWRGGSIMWPVLALVAFATVPLATWARTKIILDMARMEEGI